MTMLTDLDSFWCILVGPHADVSGHHIRPPYSVDRHIRVIFGPWHSARITTKFQGDVFGQYYSIVPFDRRIIRQSVFKHTNLYERLQFKCFLSNSYPKSAC